MTKIIMIRHGQSVSNLEHKFTGQNNCELTELGKAQAIAAANYISKTENIKCVYASLLKRAYDTGKTVADACSVPMYICDGILEINAGLWEEVPFDDLQYIFPETFTIWKNDIGRARHDGGESTVEMFLRAKKAIEQIVADNPDSTVAVASHATPIRALTTYWKGVPIEDMRLVPWPLNASLTTVIYEEDGSFHDLKTDITDHLGDMITPFLDNI